MLKAVLNKDEDTQNESVSVKETAVRYSMRQFHRSCQTENKILIGYTPTLLVYEIGAK
jgi:hypothetical protein